MPDLEEQRQRLRDAGQEHLLGFYDELDPDARTRLLEQIASLDLESLPRFIDKYVRSKPEAGIPQDLEPAPYYPHDPSSPIRPWDRDKARAAGETLLREGKAAAFTVAGGQGSRLGYDGPKGCFPGGAVTGKPLFAFFAEGIRKSARKYGRAAPWYIMTSPLNHEPTVRFFREHSFFGLDEKDVMFFQQGVMPSMDMDTGKVLLAGKGEVATNPDGHGGSIKALWVSGAIDDMKSRGVEQISYFQVDNPIVRVLDPVFLGLHAAAEDSSGQMSSKMVPKVAPEEKVGVFCRAGGRTIVIEYSDLPDELARQRGERGELRFLAGSIAIHVISVDFVEKLNTEAALELSFHRAEKQVPHVDLKTGRPVDPGKPNAVKLERFVFDALPLCGSSIVLETDRTEEFAPIKNATGVDSVESSTRIQTERAARWLEAAGVSIPRRPDGSPDCVIELSPLTAVEAADLQGADLPERIEPGAEVAV